jgi:hypothetical protein
MPGQSPAELDCSDKKLHHLVFESIGRTRKTPKSEMREEVDHGSGWTKHDESDGSSNCVGYGEPARHQWRKSSGMIAEAAKLPQVRARSRIIGSSKGSRDAPQIGERRCHERPSSAGDT